MGNLKKKERRKERFRDGKKSWRSEKKKPQRLGVARGLKRCGCRLTWNKGPGSRGEKRPKAVGDRERHSIILSKREAGN